MARYSDEAYVMISDSREKKSIAASAFKQKTHCGKSGSVKFPSDYMTKKELQSMNGECIKYASLKKPMTWEEFKVLPDDLKKEYIKSLREKFNVPDTEIANMFGVMKNTVHRWLKCLNLTKGMGSGNGRMTWDKEGWLAWLNGAEDGVVKPSETPVVEETEEPVVESASVEPLEAVGAANMVVINTEDNIAENPCVETVTEAAEGPNIVNDICEKVMQMINYEIDKTSNSGCSVECACGETVEKKRTVPHTGEMSFKGNADEILESIRLLLDGSNVRLNVSWTIVKE